jgi:folate-dependent phosphoribosylglycinamide formyltransferase PurN
MKKKKIAIFASGQGSNASQLIKHFKNHPNIQVGIDHYQFIKSKRN